MRNTIRCRDRNVGGPEEPGFATHALRLLAPSWLPAYTVAAMTLAGKVALVTGSGRNIGRAIALGLAAAGADVVVNARSSKDEVASVAAEIEAAGRKTLPYLADIRDPEAVRAMIAAAREQLG